jgi:hypothetical protein
MKRIHFSASKHLSTVGLSLKTAFYVGVFKVDCNPGKALIANAQERFLG